ncbi:MAG TPA: hypothetical protein PK156_04105 [Polyangium sp.]|nr:hypothetical protein [Polyangium sp.]
MRKVLAIWAMPLALWGCSSSPPIVSAQPLPSATSVAPSPTTIATSQTSAQPVAAQLPPPAPAPSPIAQLLANPPAKPSIPARTCPKLPKRTPNVDLPGKGSAVVVTVMDYLSLAPIADVRVNVFHGDICLGEKGCGPSHPHPDELLKMTGKTDAQGRIVFDVPDLDYSIFIPQDPVPGHLPFEPDYNLGSQKCHELSHERRSVNGRALIIEQYMVPETMLAIRKEDDAIAGAMQLPELVTWLQDHQDMPMTVRRSGGFWEVGFGEANRIKRLVQVDGFTGSARMLLRWD